MKEITTLDAVLMLSFSAVLLHFTASAWADFVCRKIRR